MLEAFLEIKIQDQNIVFTGVLDESFVTADFISQVQKVRATYKTEHIGLDFSNVQYANSLGIATWIKLIDQLKDGVYHYKKTPIWLVHIMSIISGVIPANFYVTSIFVPFYSEKHDKEIQTLMDIGKDIPIKKDYSDFNLESKTVEGVYYEPDISSDHFFRFLAIDHDRFTKVFIENQKK